MNILYLIKDILVMIGRGVLRCGIVFNFKFLIFKKKKSRKKKLKSKIIFPKESLPDIVGDGLILGDFNYLAAKCLFVLQEYY